MSRGFRLPAGGLVDRSQPRAFTFDGRAYNGFGGDTLASALLASGVRLFGRSFKYHRRRGLLTAGPEEPNALVELRCGARREPNTRATTIELFDGLEACSQNRWPSLRFDLLSVNSLFGSLFAAGFYYKTFMWPGALWELLYEPFIRRAAGLGRIADGADPDRYERAHAFCDLLVIGGGPAGIAAALVAARTKARVILCDEDFALGGRLLSERLEIDGMPAAQWAAAASAELASASNLTFLARTQGVGSYDGGVYGALERVADHVAQPRRGQCRQRLWRITARRTIYAGGAIERQLVFGGNDRPGVMMAAGVRTYVNRFGVAPGRNVAVFTTTDDGWKTAADLAQAGIAVAAVIDARKDVDPVVQVLAGRAPIYRGAQVADVRGAGSVTGVDVIHEGRRFAMPADVLAVSGGWSPQLGPLTHRGHRPQWRDDLASFVAPSTGPDVLVAGAAAGSFGLADCLREGAQMSVRALADLGFATAAPAAWSTSDESCGLRPLWRVQAARTKAFVDLQHDVTDRDIELSVSEGFRSSEHLKRYTTLGMGTDQGKSSQLNALASLAQLTGRTIAEIGTPMARPPHQPLAIGALAGRRVGARYRPCRRTAGHDWAVSKGATFVDVGLWRRPQMFPRPGERDWQETVSREVRAVRTDVGVCDVSMLGKIDVQGRDAVVFLDRVYANSVATLPVGRSRYGVMLREDGIVFDDGTIARLADERFLLSTTSANGERVMQHLEFCAEVHWPELDVQLTPVTEQWSQYAIAGPRSRELLARVLGPAVDVSDAVMPRMCARELTFEDAPARLMRISFSGERAFELAVPASRGKELLRRLFAIGADLGATPYGSEALSVLRIEKGFLGGAELNGQTTLSDLGLAALMSKEKDFIGRVMAQRPALADSSRPQLAGFRALEPHRPLSAGAHFLPVGARPASERAEGYMTSVAWSPDLGSWIGLGLIRHGRARWGEVVRAWDGLRGTDLRVQICSPVFIDPEGARARG
ncbi:MAG TPA: sarcosine oxidase subunit alpha family protein [Steroidobacteraceae bacterium]|nr:sarcosine oxidase subunit alpha family protein [Steroidobacteraceae bacterium]